MPRYTVQLAFDSDDDRAVVLQRLAELADGAATTANDGGARLVFDDVESPIAALVRAHMLVCAACAGTDVAPTRVRRSPAT
jgi:hypothetical protein